MVKKHFQFLNRSILMSELRFRQDEHETDAKNRSLTNLAFELTNPLEMVKKHFILLNRSVLMSEQGFRPKL